MVQAMRADITDTQMDEHLRLVDALDAAGDCGDDSDARRAVDAHLDANPAIRDFFAAKLQYHRNQADINNTDIFAQFSR